MIIIKISEISTIASKYIKNFYCTVEVKQNEEQEIVIKLTPLGINYNDIYTFVLGSTGRNITEKERLDIIKCCLSLKYNIITKDKTKIKAFTNYNLQKNLKIKTTINLLRGIANKHDPLKIILNNNI